MAGVCVMQAELVTSLLSRLVPVWGELGPTQGEGLRHAVFRLALAFCCLDTKSSSPIVKYVSFQSVAQANLLWNEGLVRGLRGWSRVAHCQVGALPGDK